MRNHIFGYGSLVNEKSREATGESELIGPVRVSGIKRSWNVQVADKTLLGVVREPGAVCNGVVIAVSEQELAKYDERESPEYKRVEIPLKDIEFLNGKSPSGIFWIYIAIDPKSPDAEHPIPKSYIDVVITGFLDFGLDFAKDFIDSTTGWRNIVNDRDNPLYSEPLKDVEHKAEIDSLLYGIGEAS